MTYEEMTGMHIASIIQRAHMIHVATAIYVVHLADDSIPHVDSRAVAIEAANLIDACDVVFSQRWADEIKKFTP